MSYGEDMFFSSIDGADTEAPSVPAAPTYSTVCQTTFTLKWVASTDNVAVTGYKVWKNDVLYQDVGLVTQKGITGQTAGGSATWKVSAYDAASNESAKSFGTIVTQSPSVTTMSLSSNGHALRDDACTDTSTTKYHDGLGSVANGDIIYSNSCASTVFDGSGGDFWSDGDNSFAISSVGVVSSLAVCTI